MDPPVVYDDRRRPRESIIPVDALMAHWTVPVHLEVAQVAFNRSTHQCVASAEIRAGVTLTFIEGEYFSMDGLVSFLRKFRPPKFVSEQSREYEDHVVLSIDRDAQL